MSGRPDVFVLDEQSVKCVKRSRWERLALEVLVAEGVEATSELNLTFVDTAEMTQLNVEHMDGVGPTDVLSFPLDDSDSVVLPGQKRLLGDVVICPEVVAAQAADSLDDEMALMVVHGVLHILGMDHQETAEAEEMKAAEKRHLAAWRSSDAGALREV